MKPMVEQIPMFTPDSWFGKMFRERSVPTRERTSEPCWRKLQGSQTKPFLFLDMRGGGGQTPELLSVTDGLLRGDCTTLNFGESPNAVRESRLSQILEDSPLPKYSLSAKACQGILNRAAKRGKKLPEILEAALRQQARSRTPDADGGTNPTSEQLSEPRGGDAVKANLVCIPEISRTLSARYDSIPCVDRGQEFVCIPINTMCATHTGTENSTAPFGIGKDGDPQFTLQNKHHHAVFAIEGNGSRDSHFGNGYKESEIMYSLNTVEVHGVCAEPLAIEMTSTKNTVVDDGISPTLTARMGTGGESGQRGVSAGDAGNSGVSDGKRIQ